MFSDINIITAFDVLEHIEDLDKVIQIFKKLLNRNGNLIISGPTENFLYKLARKVTRIGLKGNILGEEEHVSNILDIKNRITKLGFIIKKDVSIWNLFHVTSFISDST